MINSGDTFDADELVPLPSDAAMRVAEDNPNEADEAGIKKRKASDNSPSFKKHQSWIKKIGPGLITGAADDDPSGIATYSQAGV
ncbi:MAG: iron transporter [Verrucomicrobiaceae bacterium]|nr:iron transporter [Verrucomicrobiaceae bacterium]